MDQTVAVWDDHKPMLRTLFSSMFARRMPYLIVGASEHSVMYTNIEPDRVALYQPGSDDFFHVVSVKGKNMVDQFLAPLVGNRQPYVLEVALFTKAMNKLKGKVELLQRGSTLIIPKVPQLAKPVPPSENGEQVADPDAEVLVEMDLEVGRCLTPSETNGYRELLAAVYRQLESGTFQDTNLLTAGLDSLQDIMIFPFHHQHHDTLLDRLFELDYGIPIRAGESTISIKEYRAEGEPCLKIHLGFEGLSLKHLVDYSDAAIHVMSIQPGQRWFARSK